MANTDDHEDGSDFSTVSQDSESPIQAFGHTYHGSGRIMQPNDESSAELMALFDELYKLCLNGRLTDSRLPIEHGGQSEGHSNGHRRPSSASSAASTQPYHVQRHDYTSPYKVLDIGAGSGLWAVDMAQTFPEAEVLGIDLTSALIPKDVPPNLTFEIADIAEPWGPDMYDLIYSRNPIGGGITDWPALVTQAWNHLKPGGQIEFTSMQPKFYGPSSSDTDFPGASGEMPDIGTACREFELALRAMWEAQGVEFDPLSRIGLFLTRLGAESVRERGDWLPVTSWGGGDPITVRKGELAEQIMDHGLDHWALMIFVRCGWSEADTRDLLRRVKEEIKDPSMKTMFRL
jgi:SAM-dependent methyltransferase